MYVRGVESYSHWTYCSFCTQLRFCKELILGKVICMDCYDAKASEYSKWIRKNPKDLTDTEREAIIKADLGTCDFPEFDSSFEPEGYN